MKTPLKQLTQDALLALYRDCPKEDEATIKAEIERRIKEKSSKPHEENCLCSDCVYQEN